MTDTVIVGVDGSDPAQHALAWAAAHARRLDAALQVVTVYGPREERNPHSLPDGGIAGVAGPAELEHQAQLAAQWREQHERWTWEQAMARIDKMLAKVDGDLPDRVERVAIEGTRPSRVLMQLAEDADLLVVGPRGRGGFADLVLGSVSQQLTHHAPCPVVVVRNSAT